MQGFAALNSTRLTRVVNAIQDVREIPGSLANLGRCPQVPAINDEIIGHFIGRVYIADVISDGQRARSHKAGRVIPQSYSLPNIKVGYQLNEADLKSFHEWGLRGTDGEDAFSRWQENKLGFSLLGVRQRQEQMITGMKVDALDYAGFGVSGSVTWGMPSDLKVTVGTAWTDASNATPVDDILTLKLTAKAKYGETYNRIEMSLSAFQLMIATTNFINRVKSIPLTLTNYEYTNLSRYDIETQVKLASTLLGMELIVRDDRYWFIDGEGNELSYRYHPINMVVLSDSQDDGREDAWDFAVGTAAEALMSDIAGTQVIGGAVERVENAPVSFATSQFNPPQVELWTSMVGFPRKHRKSMHARINVGTVTESIATGVSSYL